MYAIDFNRDIDIEFAELVEPVAVRAPKPRCADGHGTLTHLFFSEDLGDIARAKSFCAECPVRAECLATALDRQEPWGVWGSELFVNGRVVANKRRRGRPPKVTRVEPTLSWEIAVADIA